MSTIVTRTIKGSPLTWAEADANFDNLNTDKVELADLGDAATLDVGTTAGTVAAGDHTHSNYVTGPASVTDNVLAAFDGTTGKLIKAYSGSVGTGDVVGPSSSTDGYLAVFDGTTGKLLKSGGAVPAVDIPQSGSDKTTSYTLATTDNGKFIGIGSGGSITIPDATFSAGNAVSLFNNTSGNITITCTITTAYIAGTDSDKATMTLATRGVANILFLSGTVCVVTGNVS